MNIKDNYNHTLYASYIGYITQAIVNNFAPLLFLTFHNTYHISLGKITFLITCNFGIQLLVDTLSIKFADMIGYKRLAVIAHVFAALGLAGLGIFPEMFADPYLGLLAAISLYAVGGGLIEVLISPIVEACPTDKKSASMSLLHSFYCWGHVFVILFTTFFFVVFGIGNWKILALIWAFIPLLNAFYFSRVPINMLTGENEQIPLKKLLSLKILWVFVLLMICSGASEQAMSQWTSAFAESGLHVSKTIGDLVGTCMFAVLMGTSRVFYSKYSDKIDLQKFIIGSGCLCVVSYLVASLSPYPVLSLFACALCGLSVGILWPGTFSIASAEYPKGGTAMFAILALAGDLGCSFGPTFVGSVSNAFGQNLRVGLLAAVVFPILLISSLVIYRKMSVKSY